MSAVAWGRMGWTRADAVGRLERSQRLLDWISAFAKPYTCVIDPTPINFRLDGSLRCTTIRLCTADNRCLPASCAWHINDLYARSMNWPWTEQNCTFFPPFFLFIVARVLRSSVEKSKFNLGERRKFEIRRDIWSPGGGASDGKIGRGENNLWANYSGE